MRSDDAAFDLEASRLKRLKLQLEKCIIKAPADGMVVYANETSSFRGSTTLQIEEGTAVRERQSIIKLPDLSRMQAKVSVHESKVDQLRMGMRARVKVQGRDFQGSIVTIANQPEPGSFMSSNVKKFPTIVSIDNRGDSNLRPGMTTVVEILVDDRPNVITVPVQSVVEQGEKFYSWVLVGRRPERRPLVLGVTNNVYIEVKDGLSEGDKVLLNPRAQVPEAREEVKSKEQINVAKTFGEKKPLGEAPGGSARPSSDTGASGGSGRTAPSFADMDKNGDGKLTMDEMPEQAKQFFDRMDADHDGSVTASELAASRARMRQRQSTGGGSPGEGPPAGGQ
jgi:HlyD family secretion protein